MIPTEEERFASNLKILIKAIQSQVEKLQRYGKQTIDLTTLSILEGFLMSIDRNELINGFIENSHEGWDKIKIRDDDYFVNNAFKVFSKVPVDKINIFREIYLAKDQNGNLLLSDKLKNDIWNLFDSLIKISIKYIHRMRKPNNKKQYTKPFLEQVNLSHHVQNWKINLNWE